MRLRNLTYLLLLVLVVACKPSVPSEYIQPDDMEDILYDYHVAMAMARQGSKEHDMNRELYFQSVLRKHGITEAEFDSSLVYYYSHVYRLKDIYTQVNNRLSDEAASLGVAVGEISRYSQYSETGDTANIWKGPHGPAAHTEANHEPFRLHGADRQHVPSWRLVHAAVHVGVYLAER